MIQSRITPCQYVHVFCSSAPSTAWLHRFHPLQFFSLSEFIPKNNRNGSPTKSVTFLRLHIDIEIMSLLWQFPFVVIFFNIPRHQRRDVETALKSFFFPCVSQRCHRAEALDGLDHFNKCVHQRMTECTRES